MANSGGNSEDQNGSRTVVSEKRTQEDSELVESIVS